MRFLPDLVSFSGTALTCLLLLRYLHAPDRGWMFVTAEVGGGLVGVVARRAALRTWPNVPAILSRPVIVGVLGIGAILVALASLGGDRPEYWILVGSRALTLATVAALLAVALATLAMSHRRYAAVVEEHRRREAELEKAALAARLRALQAQMHPHFLFNTLNTLAELVHEDSARAEELIGDLAHLLRHSLRTSTEDRVPLRQEWETIERTLRIERARFGDRLTVELELDPAAAEVPIPGLVLQPLVENAVRHAIAPRPEGGRVRIEAMLRNGVLTVVVEDDGPGIPEEVIRALDAGESTPRGGSGGAGGALASVRQRLKGMTGGGGTLEIGRSESGGARLEVTIPREVLG